MKLIAIDEKSLVTARIDVDLTDRPSISPVIDAPDFTAKHPTFGMVAGAVSTILFPQIDAKRFEYCPRAG